MPDPTRKLVRERYDAIADAYLAARTTGGDVALLRNLISRLRPGERVLDAGCGAGIPVMRHLADGGLSPVGLDFAHGQLDLARQHVPAAPLVQGDLAALPYADRGFAAAVSFYAVIHVPRADHPAVFAEIHRVLRPGGLALLCLGADDLPEDHDPDSWLGGPMYWSHFDADTNLRLLRDTGFDIIHDEIVPDPMGHRGHLFVLVLRPPATGPRTHVDGLRIEPCGPERAEDVHRLTQAAFDPYRDLDPPSGAGRESVATVIEDLSAGRGALAVLEDAAVGCLRWHMTADGDFHVRRVAVDSGLQRRGVGRALMAWAEHEARHRGSAAVSVGVRSALPDNLAFYRQLGYQITGEHRHDGYARTTWFAMRKDVRRVH